VPTPFSLLRFSAWRGHVVTDHVCVTLVGNISMAVERVRRRDGGLKSCVSGRAVRHSLHWGRLCGIVLGLLIGRHYLLRMCSHVHGESGQGHWALIANILGEVLSRTLCTGKCRTRNALLLQLVRLPALPVRGWRLLEDVQEAVRRRSCRSAAGLALRRRLRGGNGRCK
jgi:hypothetical protein